MPYSERILALKKLPERRITQVLREHSIGLTAQEAKKVGRLLGRDPTLTEAVIWGIQGSEHSSYKSSKKHLSMLPTAGPNVILGPGEDAGIVEIAKINGKRYGIVISHESHNHPSQIVPYEGAATGIGGCVRDVLCMGAHVIAVADPLRFGAVKRNETKLIAEGVAAGIGGYGNPIGVPNIAGDVYFNETFNDNCLVNVVTLGLLAEDEIIHSRAPKGAEKGYNIILVGKPTAMSGMGGAAFASLQLNEEEREKNKGAVQEPNPFLKRHILQSTYDLFRIFKEKKLTSKVGFKDLGAGGCICATVEMVASSGYGADIDLKKVPAALDGLPPHVIACSETQERMCWIVPADVSAMVLKHYNETWALPKIAKGACAAVIGKVTKGNYVLR
ncbi:phosphoribosylformylglycinamidine synthase subunit PurL, partial [Candidatus Peregrinibacteria bacterium]|nr:phosphoribosylformylglycinamidine synthase subunit PurL [Candidatus Peregrinibacteria bacterium]